MPSYFNSVNKEFSQEEIIEGYFPVELKIKTLYEKINELEKEIQSLKDNFKNIYEVFFNENLTCKK